MMALSAAALVAKAVAPAMRVSSVASSDPVSVSCPSPADEQIPTGAAGQGILACATDQNVVAASPRELVVAITAV